jgi:uncharacterized membrane protein YdbT with pleckstrin-like domain
MFFVLMQLPIYHLKRAQILQASRQQQAEQAQDDGKDRAPVRLMLICLFVCIRSLLFIEAVSDGMIGMVFVSVATGTVVVVVVDVVVVEVVSVVVKVSAMAVSVVVAVLLVVIVFGIGGGYGWFAGCGHTGSLMEAAAAAQCLLEEITLLMPAIMTIIGLCSHHSFIFLR